MLLQCNQSRRLNAELKAERERVQQEINNAKAKDQQIEQITTENGDLVSQVWGYEFELGRMQEKESKMLADYQDLLDLYENLKGVNSIIRADLEIAENSLAATKALLINDTTFQISSTLNEDFNNGNSRTISSSTVVRIQNFGKTLSPDSTRYSLNQKVRLRAVIDEVEGAPRLSISTKYPGIEIVDIENINLINNRLGQSSDQEPVELGQAVGLGLGVGFGMNYTGNGNFRLGPTISVGFQWVPKKLRFK